MKVFISQPMRGKSRDEVEAERAEAVAIVKAAGHTVVDTVFDYKPVSPKELKNPPLWYLSKALNTLSGCDAAIFLTGWREARGCRIEHACCKAYGIKIMRLSAFKKLAEALR